MKKDRWISVMMGSFFFLQVLAVGLNLLLYQEDIYLKVQASDKVLSSFLLEEAEIADNFKAVSDYLRFPAVLNGEALALPHLPMSDNGRVHFYEVKLWFRAMDALFVCLSVLQLFLLWQAKKRNWRIRAGWLEIAVGGLALLLTAAVAVDFSAFFSGFHKVLFSNDYWQMDPFLDPVVLYLPESYFRYCGIFLTGMEMAGIVILEIVRHVGRVGTGRQGEANAESK